MKKIAAAYIRVSTEDQVEFSPDSQLARIKDYAKHNDLVLPEEYIYIDEGISGKDAKHRPAFNRMIGVAKTKPKPFDVILVWKFSRFARNREDSIVYKSMLRKQCDISVVSISESLGDDKTSILIEALIEAMDEYYSINLAEEVKRGMTEKASRGGIVSVPAFGYKIENNTYTPDDNAEFVCGIFADFVAGAGYREIAQKYSALGARTRAGKPLDNRFVEYLLRNPVYIGKIRWSADGNGAGKRNFDNPNTIISDGEHQPLIDAATWDTVQARIAEIKRRYGKFQRREQPIQYMLKGLVRCSACGATLVYNCAGPSLQCHNYARGSCKVSHAITVKKINAAVLEALQRSVDTLNFPLANDPTPSAANIDIDRLIKKELEKLERAKVAYTEGVDTLDEYRRNKEEIQKRIAQLQKQSPPAPKLDPKAYAKKVQSAIDVIMSDADEAVKNDALRAVIKEIIYNKADQSISVFFHI